MAKQVNSLPMYFPPAPFSLADALTCAQLVDVAYDQCAQWVEQKYPLSGKFVWTPMHTAVKYTYSAPVFWTYTWWDGTTYNEPFGFVAQAANGDTFLALRGSVTKADYEQDGTFYQTQYTLVPGYGYVHAGFYAVYQSLSPQILSIVNALKGVGRFFFAGHSLGCGLTSLAVPDVITNSSLKPSASLPMLQYILASPRVGDQGFAGAMNGLPVPTFRIVNTEDLVPNTPLSVTGSLIYQHIGTPVDFTAQYGSIDGNHSLDSAYIYALNNPTAPESVPIVRPMMVVGPILSEPRFAAMRVGA